MVTQYLFLYELIIVIIQIKSVLLKKSNALNNSNNRQVTWCNPDDLVNIK